MKKRIYDYIKMLIDTEQMYLDGDLEEMFVNISEKFGLEKYETKFLVFSFITEILKDDPTQNYSYDLGDWFYKIPEKLKMSFLKDSGWYNDYILYHSQFKDVKKVGDRLIFQVDGWSDFNECFDNDSIAKEVFSEDWLEIFQFDYRSIDFKHEIFDNLDKKSIDILMGKVKEFKGQVLEGMGYNDNFTTEDGEDPILTDELINDISNDNKLLYELIKECDLFSDLKYDLYHAYGNSYNNAAEGELFESLSDEIKTYFGDGGKWDSYKIKNKNDEERTKYILVFDITDRFYNVIIDMLIDLDRNPYDESSYFLRVLEIYLDESGNKFNTPDMNRFYPDSRKVEQYLNEYIRDNI